MPLSLVRIDDRLIHGQIVLGWVRVLKPDRIILANDRVARNSWERKFYVSSVPAHLKVTFLTLEETVRELLNNLFKSENVIVLFDSVEDVHWVVEQGVQFQMINVGGLHYKKGAEELLPYVFLNKGEKDLLRELVKKGIVLSAQDVPGNDARNINSLVL
jgi:mannose/fructose/N-acetylgalactosamine-specific phosphotransferase system component IIB